MLKGIVNDVPKDIIRIPMKGKNLWDKGVPIYAYADDYKKYNAANAITIKAGTYTISSDGILPQIQAFHADLSPYTDIQDVIQNDSSMYAGWDNRALLPVANTYRRSTIVITEDCIITMCCNSAYIGTYIMLNLGSTALPYEPYGMQNGWEVRDQQGTILWGADKTLTGTDSISFKGYGLPLKSLTVQGNGQQTGTPSPDNIIMPTFCGVRTVNLLNVSSQTLILYRGDYNPDSVINGVISMSHNCLFGFPVKVAAGTEYTVSYKSVGRMVLRVWAMDEFPSFANATAENRIINESTYKYARFTIPSGKTWAMVGWWWDGTDGEISDVMLNLGSISLPYEPYGWAEKITCAGQTVPVYLGQVSTVRRVKKLVLTGDEFWRDYNGNIWSNATDSDSMQGMTCICTHLVSQRNSGIYISNGSSRLKVYASSVSSVAGTTDEWVQYLKSQYANGTPVTIWYVLAEPTTGIVNEPLCKIGDYADELHSTDAAVTIPTANGNNILTVDTTLPPSKTTIKVHAKPVHYGFKIDKTNDNSDTAVTYTHDAVTMTPAAMNFTTGEFNYGSWENVWFVKDAYPVALNLNGTEAYRLDPDDYTKKFDGTPSDIQYVLLTEEPADWSTQWKQYYHKTGDVYELNDQNEAPAFATDTYYQLTSGTFAGNFMVAFPKVYFKRTEDATYNYVEISNVKLSDDWHAYAHTNANGDEVDIIYLPMFKGSIVSSKLRSIPGETPQGGTTAAQEVTAAEACGSRWQIWDHSSRELINDLLILMCKSIDSQGKFGKGRESGYNANDTVTYGKLQTGTLVSKGKFYGYSSSYKDVKVFGIEGFWANRFDRIQGMLLIDNVWQIKMAPPYNFTGTNFQTLSTASVPDGNGYLSKVQTSQYCSIPASISGGGSTKFYRDYFYKTATGTRVAIVGGSCGNGVFCGFRYVGVNNTASYTHWGIGASPIYK